MFLIITLAILTALFVFLTIKFHNADTLLDAITSGLATVCGICFLFSVFATAECAAENKALIEEHSYVTEAIENGETDNLGTSEALGEKIVEINGKISKSKANHKSWWNGVFYSKKVAELPYLKVPTTVNPWE